jgi:RNA polymerase sigma-70 factor (sigma-E family)
MGRTDEEFVEFAKASSARMQRAAYLLTGDRHQAEEAAQAALVRVYASWSRVRQKDPFVYARTVLVNLLHDQRRRPMREYATEFLPEQAVPHDMGDDIARRQSLISALHALSPKERSVIVLRHFLDASEADVARELDLSLGTVKSLNSRGLAKLRITAGGLAPASWTTTEAETR